MRTGELTDQKRALIEELSSHIGTHHRDIRRLRAQIATSLVGAGFCAFGCITSLVLGNDSWRGLFASLSWHVWSAFFGSVLIFLSVRAITRFTLHNELVIAGERAHLIHLFQEWAKDNRTFTADEIVVLLRSLPEHFDVWAVSEILRTQRARQ